MKKISLIIIFFPLVSSIGMFAQKSSKFNGQISLGSSLYKGNVNSFELNSRGSLSHIDSIYEYSSTYKIIYGETNHRKNNQEYYGNLKFDWLPKSKITPFVLISARQNRYRGYELVLSSLGGVKYSFVKTTSSYISISAAIQYDIEKYSSTEIATSGPKQTTKKFRLSIRPKIKQKLGPSFYIENITFFRPNISDYTDYILDSETTITNKITKNLFLNFTYDYELNNKPPQSDIIKENMSFLVSISLRFN